MFYSSVRIFSNKNLTSTTYLSLYTLFIVIQIRLHALPVKVLIVFTFLFAFRTLTCELSYCKSLPSCVSSSPQRCFLPLSLPLSLKAKVGVRESPVDIN